MLLGIPRSARCVQRFDDSLNSAIHITYRISLRSSSMREPRDPLLKVVFIALNARLHSLTEFVIYKRRQGLLTRERHATEPTISAQGYESGLSRVCTCLGLFIVFGLVCGQLQPFSNLLVNDPSAGSPTETLLRLLLPLNDQV